MDFYGFSMDVLWMFYGFSINVYGFSLDFYGCSMDFLSISMDFLWTSMICPIPLVNGHFRYRVIGGTYNIQGLCK